MKLKKTEYQCSAGKRIFEKGSSDADAMEEAVNKWGDKCLGPMEVICDDCFKEMEV